MALQFLVPLKDLFLVGGGAAGGWQGETLHQMLLGTAQSPDGISVFSACLGPSWGREHGPSPSLLLAETISIP